MANTTATTTIGSSTSITEDPSSPYFLHHSDNPGTILVTHLLSGQNYNTWVRSMTMALTAKNKLGFANGSIKSPSPTDPLSNSWIRCNSMVTSWILNAVSKDIADSLIYFNSAAAIWKDLHGRYHERNGPRIFQLKKQLISTVQGALDVNSYYTRFKIV